MFCLRKRVLRQSKKEKQFTKKNTQIKWQTTKKKEKDTENSETNDNHNNDNARESESITPKINSVKPYPQMIGLFITSGSLFSQFSHFFNSNIRNGDDIKFLDVNSSINNNNNDDWALYMGMAFGNIIYLFLFLLFLKNISPIFCCFFCSILIYQHRMVVMVTVCTQFKKVFAWFEMPYFFFLKRKKKREIWK